MQDKIINRCAASEIKCYQTVMRRKPVLEVEKNRLDNVIRQAISSLTLCSQIKPPLEPAIQKIKKDITEAKKILATAWIMPYSAIAMQTLNSLKMAEKNLKKEMEKSVFFIKEALEILKTDVKTGGK